MTERQEQQRKARESYDREWSMYALEAPQERLKDRIPEIRTLNHMAFQHVMSSVAQTPPDMTVPPDAWNTVLDERIRAVVQKAKEGKQKMQSLLRRREQ